MPNGLFNPEANTSFTSALPAPSAARKTRTSPALLSAIKRSPLGAVRMRRGFERPPRNSSTLKPSGTCGQASAGRLTSFGPLTTESVAKGFGKSAMVTRRRTPGRSVVQSPSAPWPVSTPLAGAFALLRRCELVFRKPQTHIVPSAMAMVNTLNTFTVIFSPDLHVRLGGLAPQARNTYRHRQPRRKLFNKSPVHESHRPRAENQNRNPDRPGLRAQRTKLQSHAHSVAIPVSTGRDACSTHHRRRADRVSD